MISKRFACTKAMFSHSANAGRVIVLDKEGKIWLTKSQTETMLVCQSTWSTLKSFKINFGDVLTETPIRVDLADNKELDDAGELVSCSIYNELEPLTDVTLEVTQVVDEDHFFLKGYADLWRNSCFILVKATSTLQQTLEQLNSRTPLQSRIAMAFTTFTRRQLCWWIRWPGSFFIAFTWCIRVHRQGGCKTYHSFRLIGKWKDCSLSPGCSPFWKLIKDSGSANQSSGGWFSWKRLKRLYWNIVKKERVGSIGPEFKPVVLGEGFARWRDYSSLHSIHPDD